MTHKRTNKGAIKIEKIHVSQKVDTAQKTIINFNSFKAIIQIADAKEHSVAESESAYALD